MLYFLAFNILSLFDGGYDCGTNCSGEDNEAIGAVDGFLWLAVPIRKSISLLIALFLKSVHLHIGSHVHSRGHLHNESKANKRPCASRASITYRHRITQPTSLELECGGWYRG